MSATDAFLPEITQKTGKEEANKTNKHDDDGIFETDESNGNGTTGRFSFLTYMIETTAFQGPGKIWAAPFIYLKVMWTIFLVCCVGLMCFQLLMLFKEFFSWPTKTEVSLGFGPLPLPTVTVCNVNPVRLSRVRDLKCQAQLAVSLLPEQMREDCRNQTLRPRDHEGIISYKDKACVGELCDGKMENYSHHIQRQKLIYYELAREERNFTRSLSKRYGNCYTFVMPPVPAKHSGPGEGLDLVLDLEPEEFVDSVQTGYGMRVVLHENYTLPFPGSEGYTVSAGTETNFALRMEETFRIGGRYGDCVEEDHELKEMTGYSYSISSCRVHCLTKHLYKKCGCVAAKVFSQIVEDLLDGAHAPRVFDVAKKCTTGVSESERCLRSFLQDIEVDEISSLCHCPSPCQSAFVRLRVYFERLSYEIHTEEPFYDIERFLSDIGGTLGLWIGTSVLGVFELIELAMLIGHRYSRRQRVASKKQRRPKSMDA